MATKKDDLYVLYRVWDIYAEADAPEEDLAGARNLPGLDVSGWVFSRKCEIVRSLAEDHASYLDREEIWDENRPDSREIAVVAPSGERWTVVVRRELRPAYSSRVREEVVGDALVRVGHLLVLSRSHVSPSGASGHSTRSWEVWAAPYSDQMSGGTLRSLLHHVAEDALSCLAVEAGNQDLSQISVQLRCRDGHVGGNWVAQVTGVPKSEKDVVFTVVSRDRAIPEFV